MNFLNIPQDFIVSSDDEKTEYDFCLTVHTNGDKLRFAVEGESTSWLNPDDCFMDRIQFGNLNPLFRKKHLLAEIKTKNSFDEAVGYLKNERYGKAIDILDKVLYYDPEYGEAILAKSKALYGQGHFVKSLRHYKKAIKINNNLNDVDFHKLLLKNASEERDSFPKIKKNIYNGDEAFRKGDYEKALHFYDNALANPTRFKDKILSKLLNKKATSLFKLKDYEQALAYFKKSIDAKPNDKAYFHIGIIEYFLGRQLSDEFKGHLNISKGQLIKKAGILNDIGEYQLALNCLEEYFEKQFYINDRYILALNLKLGILKALEKSVDEVESQIHDIMDFKDSCIEN
ncbi:tetratricopeptide repeat protein [Methanobrevibacter sp.]|uniref:tetratricopeptide repeat protein n=1 Tax=Methanobrevibacter sp. TaxID=66852 RepID=UPI00388D71DF